MDIMKRWKNDIRTNLIKVRNEFVNWVDSFTHQFIRQIKGIDGQPEL
jgi:hypothetical protein